MQAVQSLGAAQLEMQRETYVDAVAPAHAPADLAREIAALPACHTLYTSGDYLVMVAPQGLIPRSMEEIGRLRELSFRAVGEGTGKYRDIDVFDEWYQQLFVWHRRQQQLLGAYRLCMTDVVRSRYGQSGLYTTTLFDYDSALLDEIGPAVELGRSFVRLEFQGAGRVLALLWRGIGHLLAGRPRYRTLFGPVSVSSSYSAESRRLIASALSKGSYRHELSGRVLPKRPLADVGSISALEHAADVRALSKRVGQLESDQKGLPVLIREYIKLGGQFLGFSVDPAFHDAMDGLVVVDLERTNPRLLQLHMGQDNYEHFRQAARPVARRAPRFPAHPEIGQE